MISSQRRSQNLVPAEAATIAEQVRRIIGAGWVEELTIEAPGSAEHLEEIVVAGRKTGRKIRVLTPDGELRLPSAVERERWIRQVRDGQSAWVLQPPQPNRLALTVKRLFDIVASSVLLVVLSPVTIAVATAVKLSSPGPILYPWRVLGQNGRPFTGYKFRTMVRDAEAMLPRLREDNEMVGPVFKMAKDPRITRVGRFLRKYSLDELPQLWSVLKGDMSLVGPRPMFRHEYQDFELWQMRKLSVKPGMTCLWQVKGRNAIRDFKEWALLDLYYVDAWSLWLDVKILGATVLAVARGTGR
jgi:lipopolysaccharide/colanic/teichoic acid biosynthesis glycosyltransferase